MLDICAYARAHARARAHWFLSSSINFQLRFPRHLAASIFVSPPYCCRAAVSLTSRCCYCYLFFSLRTFVNIFIFYLPYIDLRKNHPTIQLFLIFYFCTHINNLSLSRRSLRPVFRSTAYRSDDVTSVALAALLQSIVVRLCCLFVVFPSVI